MNTRFDVSVIVATYNQSVRKTLLTLHSLIIQKKVALQIIIADDCSEKNNFSELQSYFENNDFHNYILKESKENQGTVANIYRCLKDCGGEYVKFISPGDMIYGEESLYHWIAFMKKNALDLSFCDLYNYVDDNGNFKMVKEYAFPQYPSIYNGKTSKSRRLHYQLVCNDYLPGAATLILKDKAGPYLLEIIKYARYLEDSMYKFMNADDCSIQYFPHYCMLYEINSGITQQTEKAKKWHKILIDEWYKTNIYLAKKYLGKSKNQRQTIYFSHWRKEHEDLRLSNVFSGDKKDSLKALMALYFHIPAMIPWHIRLMINRRYTKTTIDECIEKSLESY